MVEGIVRIDANDFDKPSKVGEFERDGKKVDKIKGSEVDEFEEGENDELKRSEVDDFEGGEVYELVFVEANVVEKTLSCLSSLASNLFFLVA